MNLKSRRRLIVGGGLILIIVAVVLALSLGGGGAKVMDVNQALTGAAAGQKIQVTGQVVKDSYQINGDNLTFRIQEEPSGADAATAAEPGLLVSYNGGVSNTFGNGVEAICTGKLDDQGTLICSNLVTKCPSKYTSGVSALTISQLLSYDKKSIVDQPVQVTGTLKSGSLQPVTQTVRFVLTDSQGRQLEVVYTGAIPDGVGDDSQLVLTGSLGADGRFNATQVVLS
jgi:cytochrome c-type biogenesis protein CcmE